MSHSKSGSTFKTSNNLFQIPLIAQSLNRLYTVFHVPNRSGRSRHGAPVRIIQKTASRNKRILLPRAPRHFPLIASRAALILAHCASLKYALSAFIGMVASLLTNSTTMLFIPEIYNLQHALKEFTDRTQDKSRTLDITSALSLENDTVISCLYMPEDRFLHENSPLLRDIRKEGVTL